MHRLVACVAISLALLFAGNALAQSQQSDPKPAPAKQEPPRVDQPPTESQPEAGARAPVEEATPVFKTQTPPPDDRDGRDKELSTNRRSTVSTWISNWIIPIFTIVLAGATIGIWRSNFLSSRHMRASERAYVTMSHNSPPGLKIDTPTHKISVPMEIRNHGRTPAQVSDIFLAFAQGEKGDSLPATPDYSRLNISSGETLTFLVAGDSFFFEPEFDEISADELGSFVDGSKRLWIYGYVDYIDIFEQRHRGGYAREFVPGRPQNNLVFVKQVGSNYNYDRPRHRGEGRDW